MSEYENLVCCMHVDLAFILVRYVQYYLLPVLNNEKLCAFLPSLFFCYPALCKTRVCVLRTNGLGILGVLAVNSFFSTRISQNGNFFNFLHPFESSDRKICEFILAFLISENQSIFKSQLFNLDLLSFT